MSLGDNIKKIRNQCRLTQEELGNMVGLKPITIRKYESDEREPNLDTLNKIANALKVTVNELLNVEMCFSRKIIQELELPIIRKYDDDNFLEFLSKKLGIPYEELTTPYLEDKDCSIQNQFKLFNYFKEIDFKAFLSFCIKNENFILNNDELRKLYPKSIIDNANNIVSAYKSNEFKDIISNDRDHILFSFKCLLTNYGINWSDFTDNELIEIANSGAMFDFFPKIMKTYYDFFKSKKGALNINIAPSNNKNNY